MEKEKISISLEQIKKIEIEILENVIKICDDNELKYSLMDGSLIGVIRHNGFIPWDDDIDIMMPRPDFEKLKEIMVNNPIEGLKYMSSETQEDYYYPFAKVVSTKTEIKEYKLLKIKDYGVFIDIFPIDAVDNNPIKRFIRMKSIGILRPILEISYYEEPVSDSKMKLYFKKWIALFTKKIGYHKILKLINKISKKCDYNHCKLATILYSTISSKANKYYNKEMFEDTIYKTFEDQKVKVIKEYDRYLKDLFGNYMKLPDEKDRKSNHKFDYIRYK